ncbi:MAG: hypothetical protein NTY12_04195 [Candidatus Falkowbacteria bacterium]|nr:hypothetical protein [Candidatus Falkowbacteria bacterium]
MDQSVNVKIVVFVPVDQAETVRQAMGQAGAGKIGNYSFCSYSSNGVGRFVPNAGANPAIGEIGQLEEVAEERIEMVCPRAIIKDVVEAIKKAHPYEEVACDIYPLEAL